MGNLLCEVPVQEVNWWAFQVFRELRQVILVMQSGYLSIFMSNEAEAKPPLFILLPLVVKHLKPV